MTRKPRTWKAWAVVDNKGEWMAITGSKKWARQEFWEPGDSIIRVTITEVLR